MADVKDEATAAFTRTGDSLHALHWMDNLAKGLFNAAHALGDLCAALHGVVQGIDDDPDVLHPSINHALRALGMGETVGCVLAATADTAGHEPRSSVVQAQRSLESEGYEAR